MWFIYGMHCKNHAHQTHAICSLSSISVMLYNYEIMLSVRSSKKVALISSSFPFSPIRQGYLYYYLSLALSLSRPLFISHTLLRIFYSQLFYYPTGLLWDVQETLTIKKRARYTFCKMLIKTAKIWFWRLMTPTMIECI